MVNESDIKNFTAYQIINNDLLLDLSEETPERKALLTAMLLVRAKELGIERDFQKVLKVYEAADKKLEEQHKLHKAYENNTIPLKFDGRGKPVNTIENFLTVVNNDKLFNGIKFNCLSHSPEITEHGETRRWADADDSRAREYIERKYHLHNAAKLDDALRIVFKEREYHPIKNIIEGIKWDGVERIPTLLIKWLKCEDTPYTREVSRLIFSGGINRLYNPGCKLDDVPVLIGTKQGEGKSTFVRWLALNDDFFTEISEIEGQKGIEAIEGAWICEIAELLALTKIKEVEAVKGYITRQIDRYRKPFDKRVTDYKRQCIFIGTTNKEQFLTDKTGNRRFYPIKVNQNGYELFKSEADVKADIIQCWSEAKVKYDNGKMLPYANVELIDAIRKHQQSAVEDDYRVGAIESFLENKDETCIREIWKYALDNKFGNPSKRDSNEISLILQGINDWNKSGKYKDFSEFGRQHVWIKTQTDDNKAASILDILPL